MCLLQGSYLKAGDIVSVQDIDGDVYFAQIRGLLIDQYCEKSAVLTWLVPTEQTDVSQGFDPLTFTYGKFVCLTHFAEGGWWTSEKEILQSENFYLQTVTETI